MSFVTAKAIGDYPWFIRLFFWKQKRSYGRVLEPGLLWGRSKWVFAAVALLYGALNRNASPISPALRSLVTVRVSQINHCAFCVDINSATLQKRGVSDEKIEALADWRASELFAADERLALDYAEAMTLNGVDDALRARAKGALERGRDRGTHRPDRVPEPVVQVQRGARRARAGILPVAGGEAVRFEAGQGLNVAGAASRSRVYDRFARTAPAPCAYSSPDKSAAPRHEARPALSTIASPKLFLMSSHLS